MFVQKVFGNFSTNVPYPTSEEAIARAERYIEEMPKCGEHGKAAHTVLSRITLIPPSRDHLNSPPGVEGVKDLGLGLRRYESPSAIM